MALFTSQPGFAGRTLAIDEAGGTASYGDLDALAALPLIEEDDRQREKL